MLESNRNPFATVVIAHLTSIETATDVDKRYYWKLYLIRRLYRQDVLELFRFIDWVIELPNNEEDKLWQEIQDIEEQEKMQYVTTVERRGIQKRLQKGRQEGDGSS